MNMRTILLGLAAAAVATAANATVLAKIDFDSGFIVDTGVSGSFGVYNPDTATVGPWNAAGWAGNIGTNVSTGNPANFTTLHLDGLGAHTNIDASFVLGFLDSWDSYNGSPSPDNLEIWIDGSQVANLTYNNASGTVKDIDSGTLIAEYVQANNNNFFFSDTLVGMNLSFAHTGSTLDLAIRASGAGWQGGTDESWGIDNILLTYDRGAGGVPEPATWALMIGGFGLAGVSLRRRRALVA